MPCTITSLLVCMSAAVGAILIPSPDGPYTVGMHVEAMTDTSRPDLLDPSGSSNSTRVLISQFFPCDTGSRTCPSTNVSYMTPAVAAAYGQEAAGFGLPNNTFSAYTMELCDASNRVGCNGCRLRRTKFPLILWEPAFGESRLLYGAKARSLASQGFVVVSVDHPFDANVVEFPDGTIIPGANLSDSDNATLTKVVEVRQADLSFVIDQLQAKHRSIIDFEKIAVVGHSLGGASAAALVGADKRVLGGIDLDGRLADPILSAGLEKPFILAGRQNHSSEDATWGVFWSHLRGTRMELAIVDTTHGSYEDYPILINLLNLPESAKAQIQPLVGSIDPATLDQAVNGIVSALSRLLFHNDATPLQNLNQTYPEIVIVDS